MRKIILIVFLFNHFTLPQSTTFDFHSPENVKIFADYLFCEGDFLRATEQYELLKNDFVNDTIEFKIMLGYSNLCLYQQSNKIFGNFNCESIFYPDAYLVYMKNDLLINQKPLEYTSIPDFDLSQLESFNKLYAISTLYGDEPTIKKKEFLQIYNQADRSIISHLYDYKFDPPYKSTAWAGIFSAIIPGSGKMYVGEWGDGISGLLLTGLFAFLAYDNFRADHDTRAWIFTGIGAFFYAGNIYGSIAAAQIFNAKIHFDFSNGLKLFLGKVKYFLPDYEFCN